MNNKNLEVLQSELFNMLREFKEKCEANNLRYYLFYGTLLGAVRHDGFIPWDDDIDIAMPREDADKFVELFKHYYSEKAYIDNYACDSYDSFAPNIRICSKVVSLRQDREKTEKYIPSFLSIWIIDGLPKSKIRTYFHTKNIFFHYNILRLARSSKQGIQDGVEHTKKEKIFIFINQTLKIGKLFSPRRAAKRFNKVLRKYPLNNSENCFIGWDNVGKRVFKTSWFNCGIEHIFNGESLVIPTEYDEILKYEYGDYLTLPPVEQRVPSHGIELKIAE